ncbi:MAG TPA: 2-dehydropantoate 2-reductase N-terminal domain-containing protein [Arsenicitalea sp.]|nr:2-dehydropantoate 2-reductase N-terminal domain-containing protein [Arsenicitalea sp.]
MKFVVYGVGAIGGVLAGKLALSGAEVVGIARGPQLAAIREKGLLLRTPEGEERVRFGVAGDPDEVEFTADDVIMLSMKTQDTPVALQRLRAAGVTTQSIVCAQNGVTNERFALRRFPNVYAMTVMLPASYSTAGEINAFGSPHSGILDLGRYPTGADERAATIAAALTKAGFVSEVDPKIMESKYGKLLLNLANIIEAALAPGDNTRFIAAARAEAEAVYAATGISFRDIGGSDARRQELLQPKAIAGIDRAGSSTAQSLARQTGSIETDYLNGEIVLLGRLHDIPTPVNAYFSGLAQRMLGEKLKPGTISPAEVDREMAAIAAAD